MKIFGLIIMCAFLSVAVSCKKTTSKQPTVTVHCENLVNLIKPGDNAKIDVANAFTPNGDGLNDVFRPFLSGIQFANLKIYNDQSVKIFETTQADASWTPSFSSNKYLIYYYRIEATTNNGSTMSKCGEVYMLTCFPSNINRSSFTFQDQYTGSGFTGVTAESIQTCN